jgi:uncharacterized protein
MDTRLGTALVLGCVLAGACTPVGTASTDGGEGTRVRTIRLTTGLPGAGFHPLGDALADAYRHIASVDVRVIESPGSVRNVEAIQRGEADAGFAFADVAYMAFAGHLAERPFDRLRGIAVLQPSQLHVVVRPAAGIRSVMDLRGRRVSVGPPGSGTALTADLLLHAFGMDLQSVRAETLQFSEASAELIAGTLDAIFVSASYPANSVSAATKAGARILPLEGDAIDRLRHDYPFFRLATIPAGTYPRLAAPIHTIGLDNVLLCRRDLDDSLVYDMTRQLFADLPRLAGSQPSLRLMQVANGPATPVPLHEGAARYYRQRELFR